MFRLFKLDDSLLALLLNAFMAKFVAIVFVIGLVADDDDCSFVVAAVVDVDAVLNLFALELENTLPLFIGVSLITRFGFEP